MPFMFHIVLFQTYCIVDCNPWEFHNSMVLSALNTFSYVFYLIFISIHTVCLLFVAQKNISAMSIIYFWNFNDFIIFQNIWRSCGLEWWWNVFGTFHSSWNSKLSYGFNTCLAYIVWGWKDWLKYFNICKYFIEKLLDIVTIYQSTGRSSTLEIKGRLIWALYDSNSSLLSHESDSSSNLLVCYLTSKIHSGLFPCKWLQTQKSELPWRK